MSFSGTMGSGQQSDLQASSIDLDVWNTCCFLIGGLIMLCISRILYSLYLGPLSGIPGPKLAAITDLWLLNHLCQFRKASTVHACFKRYGPIVRIGPRNIALNTEEDIKKVYGIGTKFVKSEWYLSWSLKGFDSMFTIPDHKLATDRRRITANMMTQNSLSEHLDGIHQRIKDLNELCRKAGKENNLINFRYMWRYFTLDVLGSTILGRSFDLMKTGKQHQFIKDFNDCFLALMPKGYCSAWLWWLVTMIPYPPWQSILSGEDRLVKASSDIIQEKLQRAENNNNQVTPEDSKTIVGRYIEYRDNLGNPLPSGVIDVEVATVYIAGTDTTAITLSFITWELASKPELQDRLFEELKANMPVPDEIPAIEDVEAWPLLNAVIHEALRLYAAAPNLLERVVPPGGATLQGHHIPAGTIVGMQALSMHRNEDVFSDPDTFNPDRWFHPTTQMKRHFMPFGLGSRICIGMHLAMLELRLSISSLVRQFKLHPLPDQDPEAMKLKDLWLIMPVGDDVNLQVVPRGL